MKRILAVMISALLLLLAGCDMPSINLTGYDTYPEDDLQAFIDCLNSGRYDDSSVYLNNYSSLGFESFDEGSIYAGLLSSLNSSRSFTVLGSSSVKGRAASMSIEFTTLDFRKLEQDLSSASVEAVDDYQFETGELPDDAKVEEIMGTVLDTLLLDPTVYYTTQEFRLSFYYEDDIWKLDCTDEFYSALIGYIV